jgi:pimeloyl-ACP methyl ester carboxylesterase
VRFAYLHGFASGPGSTKARFFHTRFAEVGIALEVPDLAPDFTTMTVTSMLAIVDRILDAGETVLFGSSLGGYLAALAAAQRPEAVSALVLLAPAFGFAARWEASLGAEGMARWRARGTAPVFHYGRNRQEPLGIALLDDAHRHPAEPDPGCPALVLHGQHDASVPLAAAEAFVARRPDQRRLVVYDAGHELTEVTEPMWDETRHFLAGLGCL